MDSDKPENTESGVAEEKEEPHQISRLNSISNTVSAVTEKSKKYITNIKEQAIPQKPTTQINKKTLDGIMIDERLATPEGIIFKAKMIGSLSVEFHHGDRMAIDAIRDLKTFAKTSGRHKARIFIKLSTSGIQIYEDGTMKSIDNHDLDKISYLTQDVDDKKVFAYIYNKQILNKDKGTSSIAHRLFAIKSPKCALIVTHMKAVFHYMYETKRSKNKENTKNVDMSKIREQVAIPTAPQPASPPPEVEELDDDVTTGFGYGKLVDLVDTEDIVKPAVEEPAEASNLYSSMPRKPGNKLVIEEDADDEPLYSTVKKIKSPKKEVDVQDEWGMLNPTWNKSENTSIQEDDPFSLDKYRAPSTSSSSDDDGVTFTIPVTPAKVPSAVFVDDYDWDVEGDRPKRLYSEGHVELADSRERLSTITKKAVASLERSRSAEKPAMKTQSSSLIDFTTFQDTLEDNNAVDLFDTLKPAGGSQQTNSVNNDLFSLVLNTPPAARPTTSMNANNADTKKYEIDLNSLLSDPNTYQSTGVAAKQQPSTTGLFNTPFPAHTPANTGLGATNSNTFGAGSVALGATSSGYGGAFGGGAAGAAPGNAPNYQPNYSFPVQFGTNQVQPQVQPAQSSNPFHGQKVSANNNNSTAAAASFDPFSDLLSDVI